MKTLTHQELLLGHEKIGELAQLLTQIEQGLNARKSFVLGYITCQVDTAYGSYDEKIIDPELFSKIRKLKYPR